MLVTDDDAVERRIDDRSLSRIAGAELNGALASAVRIREVMRCRDCRGRALLPRAGRDGWHRRVLPPHRRACPNDVSDMQSVKSARSWIAPGAEGWIDRPARAKAR